MEQMWAYGVKTETTPSDSAHNVRPTNQGIGCTRNGPAADHQPGGHSVDMPRRNAVRAQQLCPVVPSNDGSVEIIGQAYRNTQKPKSWPSAYLERVDTQTILVTPAAADLAGSVPDSGLIPRLCDRPYRGRRPRPVENRRRGVTRPVESHEQAEVARGGR